MKSLIRKARHVLDDPVLRRWLVRRLAGLEKPPPVFVAGQPPYLPAVTQDAARADTCIEGFPAGSFQPPQLPIAISLPGRTVELAPEDPSALFTQSYDDLETQLAAHRFAWVPIAGDAVDPDWVAALWGAWADRFGSGESGWPWHAYTAAERAINIIDFARRFGLPGEPDETGALLVRHAEIIRGNLEYFGEHYTSNHLSNNGRGLLRIGTALGRDDHAETGAKIMVAEAGRIFGRSGMLREGSTHYHLLLTRNYIDAWLDAKSAGLEQAAMLRDIAERALAVIPGLCLPGGLPLIGDISPDVPPAFLAALSGHDDPAAWPVNLPEDRRRDARSFIGSNNPVSPDRLAGDGWHRFGGHGWQALAFVSPNGWPPMPGHGHNDLGSFELHDGATPVIIDPGRGTYVDTVYADADMHNYITIDDAGPMAVNRPYYSGVFRRGVIGATPTMSRTRDGRILCHEGFSRYSKVGAAEREWRFHEGHIEIVDRIAGRGHHRIRRRFFTGADASISDAGAVLAVQNRTYCMSSTVPPTIGETICWTGYGRDRPGRLIVFDQPVSLPFEMKTVITRLSGDASPGTWTAST